MPSDFGIDKRVKNGLRSACKACYAVMLKDWRLANIEKKRADNTAWRLANPDKVKESSAKWYAKNFEKVSAYTKAWYAAHLERALAVRARWKAENKARAEAAGKIWKAANREKVRSYVKAWKKANPDAVKSIKQNRRARAMQAAGKLSRGLNEKLFRLQRGKCACCSRPLGSNYHMDHIMPLALGGSNTDDNIQLLRAQCNNQKYKKHPVDFMQERGFLL